MPVAKCHPEKANYSRGLCRSCYNKEPDIKAYNDNWRRSDKRKQWVKEYDKGPVRAAVYRRYRHSFTADDEKRF